MISLNNTFKELDCQIVLSGFMISGSDLNSNEESQPSLASCVSLEKLVCLRVEFEDNGPMVYFLLIVESS
jgi:hypothetical protein